MSIRLKDGIVGNLSGNANTATTLQTARNIKIGNTTRSFNGSNDITWTVGDIGAATSNHNHDNSYLKLSGGTVSGDILSTGMFTTRSGNADASLRFLNDVASIRYGGTGTGSSNGFNIVGSGDNIKLRIDENGELYARGNQRVYHAGYKPNYSDVGAASASHSHSNYAPTSHNHTSLTGVNSIAFASHETDSVSMGVLVDGTKSYMDFNLADDLDDMWRWRFTLSGSPTFNAMTLQALSGTTARLTVAGEIAATSFSGAFSGNAKTATSLQTARSIFGQSFNGNADVQGRGIFYGSYASSATTRWQYAGVEIREAGLVSNKQSDIAYAPRMSFHWGNTIASSIAMSSTGEFQFTAQNGTSYSNVRAGTFIGALSGNATTATTLQNAKTIKIGNTSRNFDGSSNVSWSLGDIGATTGVVANALVQRDVNSDISVRLVKATYTDQSTVTGALAFRVNNSSDNYVRFCSNPTAINNWLGLGSVPTHAPLITNLNSQLQSGWYSINTSTTGRPSGVDYGVVLQVRWYNGADFYQILVSSNNSRLYTRGYINGGYTSWNEK